MPKVICTLPNASELINGVRFLKAARGMLSEDLDEETANRFLAVTGFELQHAEGAPSVPPTAPPATQPKGGKRGKTTEVTSEPGKPANTSAPDAGAGEVTPSDAPPATQTDSDSNPDF